jgi:chromosome segregation ATPase
MIRDMIEGIRIDEDSSTLKNVLKILDSEQEAAKKEMEKISDNLDKILSGINDLQSILRGYNGSKVGIISRVEKTENDIQILQEKTKDVVNQKAEILNDRIDNAKKDINQLGNKLVKKCDAIQDEIKKTIEAKEERIRKLEIKVYGISGGLALIIMVLSILNYLNV